MIDESHIERGITSKRCVGGDEIIRDAGGGGGLPRFLEGDGDGGAILTATFSSRLGQATEVNSCPQRLR